jgi:hypothetical protein
MSFVTNSFAARAGFPDVCLTPSPAGPLPVAYPNLSAEATDPPIAARINMGGGVPGTIADIGTVSMGDQTGVTGVASGTVMMGAHGLVGNPKLLLECMPAKNWVTPHISNSTNCPAFTVLPGEFKVLAP